jgi:hypothetical protein
MNECGVGYITGLYWDEGEPALELLSEPDNGSYERHPLDRGQILSVSILGAALCIGSFDAVSQRRIPCPRCSPVAGGRDHLCTRCSRTGANFYARTGIPTGSYGEARLREQDHIAYIALFGRSTLKVGVAATWRRRQRLLEQGAAAALMFARGSGDDVRELERSVAKDIGVRQSIQLHQKLRCLWDLPEQEESQRKLSTSVDEIYRLLPSVIWERVTPIVNYIYNVPQFRIRGELQDTRDLILIEYVHSPDVITGSIIGCVGQVLLLKAGDDRTYAVDARALTGHLVRISDRGDMSLSGKRRIVGRGENQQELF